MIFRPVVSFLLFGALGVLLIVVVLLHGGSANAFYSSPVGPGVSAPAPAWSLAVCTPVSPGGACAPDTSTNEGQAVSSVADPLSLLAPVPLAVLAVLFGLFPIWWAVRWLSQLVRSSA